MRHSIPWLTGDGEMAELIRAKDWSKTSLGPIEEWPTSLQTTLGVVLRNRFAMMIWWGPELLNFYNDAYRPILRDKHPDSLGASAPELWSEIWDFAGPLAQSVMDGGPATWMEDTQLFIKSSDMIEETYFTFSYSPIPGDDGKVAGVLNTVQESTVKVQGERLTTMLHDLAAHASVARSEGEAYRVIMNVLSEYELDIPFALLYKYDDKKESFQLSGSVGFGQYDGPAKKPDSWPLQDAIDANDEITIDDIDKKFPSLPKTEWGGSPKQAIILPIVRSEAGVESVLVAGISPHRKLDVKYSLLFVALADQLTNVMVNARAIEIEKKRIKELASLDQAKTAFFSNISHEFRTPLTLMLGPMQEGLLRADLPEDYRAQLELMYRNVLRLQRLVNSLLEFSRIEAGKFTGMFEPVEVGQYTAELASAFQSAIQEAGLTFEVDCKPLKRDVYVDYEKWETIVLNLLSNALKFTFVGSIKISVKEKADHVELVVEDTGIGVPKEEIPRLFERFHQIKDVIRSRTVEGSGIGLAVVNELVKIHGGTIKVESKVERGTRFTIRIPFGSSHLPKDQVFGKLRGGRDMSVTSRAYTDEAMGWVKKDKPRSIGEETKQQLVKSRMNETILIVDDNADMRGYIARILDGNTSLSIETATDGLEALKAIKKKLPSLIITDIMMPNMDGISLVGMLRKDPRTAKIPIIFLSARAGDREKAEGIIEGVDAYLTKPFSIYELVATVRTHLDLAALREK